MQRRMSSSMAALLVIFLLSGTYITWQQIKRYYVEHSEATHQSHLEHISEAVEWPERDAIQHRLTDKGNIRTRFVPSTAEVHPAIELQMVIGKDGTVLAAHPLQGPQRFYSEAITIAKRSSYRPFEADSKPTIATFRESVQIFPLEKKRLIHVNFPAIHDWKSVQIVLERSACFGICPQYRVEIQGDGTVIYKGQQHVAVVGERRSKISVDSVHKLVELFRAADYFSLLDEYRSEITDNPIYTTHISMDGVSKSVVDYVGEEAGMPSAVSELEDSIDQIAQIEKWTKKTSSSKN